MTNTNTVNELVAKIDNFIAYEINRSYERLEETSEDSLMYDARCGRVDAIYSFAYAIVDEYSVQDAIDDMKEDISYYADKAKYYAFHRAYVAEARRIIRTIENFTNWYYINNMYEYPIKHVLSIVGLNNFGM